MVDKQQANALFVVYVETVMATSCAAKASDLHRAKSVAKVTQASGGANPAPLRFYSNPFRNDPKNPLHYQDVPASIRYG